MQAKTREESIEQVAEIVKDITIAMLVTLDADGRPRSRPMSTQRTPFDGTLWFCTSRDSDAAGDIEREPRINLAYASSGSERYLSVTGSAEVVDDRAQARALWSPILRAWFDSPDDPDLRLIRVDVEHAEYWDTPGGKVASLFALVKGALTGDGGSMQSDVGSVSM